MRVLLRNLVLGGSVLACHEGLATEMSVTQTSAIETSASVDLVSAYVFRGITLNEGAAVQPGVEVSIGNATFGVWGSQAMDAEEFETEREVDIYAGYDVEVSNLSVSFGIVEYIYPDEEIDNDREVSVALAVDTILSPSIAVNQGIAGAVEDTTYLEFGVEERDRFGRVLAYVYTLDDNGSWQNT